MPTILTLKCTGEGDDSFTCLTLENDLPPDLATKLDLLTQMQLNILVFPYQKFNLTEEDATDNEDEEQEDYEIEIHSFAEMVERGCRKLYFNSFITTTEIRRLIQAFNTDATGYDVIFVDDFNKSIQIDPNTSLIGYCELVRAEQLARDPQWENSFSPWYEGNDDDFSLDMFDAATKIIGTLNVSIQQRVAAIENMANVIKGVLATNNHFLFAFQPTIVPVVKNYPNIDTYLEQNKTNQAVKVPVNLGAEVLSGEAAIRKALDAGLSRCETCPVNLQKFTTDHSVLLMLSKNGISGELTAFLTCTTSEAGGDLARYFKEQFTKNPETQDPIVALESGVLSAFKQKYITTPAEHINKRPRRTTANYRL